MACPFDTRALYELLMGLGGKEVAERRQPVPMVNTGGSVSYILSLIPVNWDTWESPAPVVSPEALGNE